MNTREVEAINQLLRQVGMQLRSKKQKALQVNFLEVLGLSHDEVSHSRFLAFLLNPSGSHGQGTLFLRTFLKNVLLLDGLPDHLENVWVTTETVIGGNGRLDILLRFRDGHWIAIENKVNSQEGDGQIPRYKEFLSRQAKHTLVFLTPEGKPPQNAPPGFDKGGVKALSYRRIAQWLFESLQDLPDRLKIIVEQCSETWRSIGTPGTRSYMTNDKEISEYLMQPNNFEIALDIAAWVKEYESLARDEFWTRLEKMLTEKLLKSNYSHKWQVIKNARYGWIGIFWNESPVEPDKYQFAVIFERWNRDDVQYGIARGGELKGELDKRDEKLKSILEKDGFRHNRWYTGMKHLAEDMTVKALYRDNQDSAHLLAEKLANELWLIFDNNREALEDLNERYPNDYPSRAKQPPFQQSASPPVLLQST